MTDVESEPVLVPTADGVDGVTETSETEKVADAGGDDAVDEGDIAADYIEELLDICDLDGDIDIDQRGGRAYVSVDAADSQDLRLLSNPETVTALQELTRLASRTRQACSAV
ncbi:hypothetical protein CMMCAS06_08665 [Clavibacter michiganensis subsp. michiganensis]|nr:hypothetical protein CMMCAS06_08665 [Clavibacter michiganensis subsp. michiganensis]